MGEKQKTVLLIGTCDTKGEEILFMKDIIESKGLRCSVLDLGLMADPSDFTPEITRKQLSEAAGASLDELIESAEQGRYEPAVEKMAIGAEIIVQKLYSEGEIDGMLVIGGSMGTALGLRILRALPIGVPKVLISTIALSEYLHPHFVKSDIVVVQPLSDFFGINQWSKRDLKRAALSISSIVAEEEPMEEGKWIGLTAIGWVAACATALKKQLEKNGYKVAVGHSVSMQGGILEHLAKQGVIKGMIDLCNFELIHKVAGGACHSESRLTVASEKGVPMIVAPGCMTVFTMSTLRMPVFEKQGRFTIAHNELIGTAKPTTEEMIRTAELTVSRLNKAKGKVAYVVPKRGFDMYDKEGKMYHTPEGRAAFIDTLKKGFKSEIQFEVLDCHWEEPAFEKRIGELSLEYFADIQ